jgi:hypothetical protein
MLGEGQVVGGLRRWLEALPVELAGAEAIAPSPENSTGAIGDAARLGGWAFEMGARYWASTGRFQKDIDTPSLISRITFDGVADRSGELFARIDTPSKFFVKGFAGIGSSESGHMNDEDWGIPDPKEMPPEQFRAVRDLIGQKVCALLGAPQR